MWVGAARFSLRLRSVDSLKAKRSLLARLKSQAQSRLHVVLAECDAQDSKDWAVLAGAWVVADRDAHIRRANAVAQWFDEEHGMQVVRLERFEQPMPKWTACPLTDTTSDLPDHWLSD